MPSSIPYSSILPKFPDNKRRPGIIQLPQALPALSRPPAKLSAHSAAQKPSSHPPAASGMPPKPNAQLRTPSPSPGSRAKSQQARRKSKRSSSGSIVVNIGEFSAVISSTYPPSNPEAPSIPASAGDHRPGLLILSPPPTPAQRATNKSSRSKSRLRAAGHARQSSKPLTLPVSPPLTPELIKFPSSAVEEAVPAPLLPPIGLAQDMDGSDDSLPLADEDEVIVWKQPLTPTLAVPPAPKQRVPGTPSRTPSPNDFFKWEDVKDLPRLSPATIAQLKEQYDIRPSEAFQHQKKLDSNEPDLLMSLLHSSSSSCPPSPGVSPGFSVFPTPSRPIAIARRANGSHARTPSFPAYPTSGRIAMMQYKEGVAEAFGLDVRDELAVQKATEAWRAYAGSTFNNSPETERISAPKFLGRLFL